MEDEQLFIDKLVKNSVKDYKEQPYTAWNELEKYMGQKGVMSKSSKFFNTKTNIAIVSGVVVITAGIYFLTNTPENRLESKKNLIEISDTTAKQKNTESILKIEEKKTKTDASSGKINSTNNKNKNETVKIRVEVPVHKKVMIKKQIIIKDTLN